MRVWKAVGNKVLSQMMCQKSNGKLNLFWLFPINTNPSIFNKDVWLLFVTRGGDMKVFFPRTLLARSVTKEYAPLKEQWIMIMTWKVFTSDFGDMKNQIRVSFKWLHYFGRQFIWCKHAKFPYEICSTWRIKCEQNKSLIKIH